MTGVDTVRDRLARHTLTDEPPEAREAAAAPLASALSEDGGWPDIDYADTARADWPPFRHAVRTLRLARSPAHASDALRAAEAWRRRAPRSDNWWYNEIGAPQTLGDALLLLHDLLTPAQRRAWGGWLAEAPGPVELTGQNVVWSQGIEVRRAALVGDAEALGAAVRRMEPVLRTTEGEGIQDDLSFHQHGPLPYTGGYGRSLVTEVTRWLHAVHGTPWAFGAEETRLLVDHVLDGHRPVIHGDGYDFTLMGREIVRPDAHHVAAPLLAALRRLIAADPPRRDELRAFAAELARVADGGEATGPVGCRRYPRSDHLVHRRPGWSFSVRMASGRTLPTECLNGENTRGRHLADGVAAVRVGGAAEDGYRGVIPVWDWAGLPGVTAERPADARDLLPRPPDRPHDRPHDRSRVGPHERPGAGESVVTWTDGRHGIALLRLAGLDRLADGWKAWFCLDDAVVALGAGITAPRAERPVVTTVDQRLATGPLTLGFSAEPGGPAAWAHHGRVGYVPLIPHPGAFAHVRSRTGRWSDVSTSGSPEPLTADVLSLGVDHGPRPENAGYAWLVVPDADAETTRRRAARPGVTVLANAPGRQVVRCDRTGRVLAARRDAEGLVAGVITTGRNE